MTGTMYELYLFCSMYISYPSAFMITHIWWSNQFHYKCIRVCISMVHVMCTSGLCIGGFTRRCLRCVSLGLTSYWPDARTQCRKHKDRIQVYPTVMCMCIQCKCMHVNWIYLFILAYTSDFKVWMSIFMSPSKFSIWAYGSRQNIIIGVSFTKILRTMPWIKANSLSLLTFGQIAIWEVLN